MASTAQRKTPPARAALAKPKPRLQKKVLTLAEAAEQWENAKRTIDETKPLLEEAGAILLAYFDRTNKAGYKHIGWTWTGGALILNQAKVREYLGEKVKDFQTRTARSRSLRLLK